MNDPSERYIRKIRGTYKNQKPTNITGIDKVHSKCDCIEGGLVNGVRETVLFSFALDKPPSHKIYSKPRVRLLKEIKKPVLSHKTFYSEDDDHIPIDFDGEMILSTCLSTQIQHY